MVGDTLKKAGDPSKDSLTQIKTVEDARYVSNLIEYNNGFSCILQQ